MSWRKGSNASVETSGGSNGSKTGTVPTKVEYPYALGLRIRVMQIVCAIGAVVMGSVAAIEERHNFNLSLGFPAGLVTVLYASWMVHLSLHRNDAGSRTKTWTSRVLLVLALFLVGALLTLSILTVIRRKQYGESHISDTSFWLALIHGFFATSILVSEGLSWRLRWIHGPPPSGPPPRNDRCPHSTSHTAVSMVPLASTCGPPASISDSVSGENTNEMVSVIESKSPLEDPKMSLNAKSSHK